MFDNSYSRICKLAVSIFVVLFAVSPLNAKELKKEDEQVVREFIASQRIVENWPGLVRAMSSNGAERIRKSAQIVIEKSDTTTAQDKKEIMSVVDSISEDAARDITEALRKMDYKKLFDEMGFRVYPKYFSIQELKQLTKFFSSPTGQKFLRLTPILATESKQAGNQNIMTRYFDSTEVNELTIFYQSEVARRMRATADLVKKETQPIFDTLTAPLVDPIVERYVLLIKQKYSTTKNITH